MVWSDCKAFISTARLSLESTSDASQLFLLTSAELLHSLDGSGSYCEDQLLALPYPGAHEAGHLDPQVHLSPSHPLVQPSKGIQEDHPHTNEDITAELWLELASEGGEEAGWFLLGRLSCWN